MSNSQELRERRAALIAEARKILDTNPNTPETTEAWDKVMADVDTLDKEIQTTERQEHQSKLEKSLAENKNEVRTAPHRIASVLPENAEQRGLAAWFARACDLRCNLSQSDYDCCDRFFGSGKTLTLNLAANPNERTGLLTTTGSSALLPTITLAEVERWLKYFAPLRNWVSVRRTLNGDPLRWPTVDPTSITNSTTQVAEAGTINEQDPTFSDITFNAYKTANVVLMSKEFIEDNVLGDGIVSLISELIGEVVGRAQEYYFELGTGSSQPLGVVTAATSVGSQTDSNLTAVTWDNMYDLLYSIDRAYQPDVEFFCSNSTMKTLLQLKDSYGRYVLQPFMNPLSGKIEEQINGHAIHILSNMSDFVASGSGSGSTVFMVAMPPKKFMIRDVRNLQISVNPYLYEGTGQVAIYGTMRSDSNYIGPGRSIAYLKYHN